MGGSNEKSNIAILTAREHFLVHWLLYKIHKNKQMTYAFFSMTKKVGNGKERYTSKSFQYAREAMAEFLSINRSGENHPLHGVRGKENPNYGSKRSEETRRKISEKARGRDSAMKKTIYCTETKEFFKSIKDAKKANKKGNISYALRFGGTGWRYALSIC